MGGRGSGNYSKAKHADIDRIVSKSIYLVEACLEDESLPLEKRLEIAAKFALKYMPEQVNHTHAVFDMSMALADRLRAFIDSVGARAQIAGREQDDRGGRVSLSINPIPSKAIEIMPLDHQSHPQSSPESMQNPQDQAATSDNNDTDKA